ncbi:cupredoxin domain-containing protein [Acidocella sp.]|jgi:plastocyanin|uniref:cupredoxin domain-containing protein n=1 Tax=Acidocella sp. TaxID=50710 RepID=UPI002F406EAF
MYLPKSVMATTVAVLLAAAPALAATETVTINNYTFTPATLTVHAGDTVIWTNQDSIPHTATALDGKSFDSGAIDPGESWKFVFTKAGQFKYRCAIHPDMRGAIDVQ